MIAIIDYDAGNVKSCLLYTSYPAQAEDNWEELPLVREDRGGRTAGAVSYTHLDVYKRQIARNA